MRALFGASTMCFVAACGPAPLQPRDPTPGVPHFVVESYNVNDTQGGDRGTLEAIGKEKAEVVCLQEITDVWEKAVRERWAGEYPYMLFHAMTGSDGLGVMSHHPLHDLGFHIEVHQWHPAWHVSVDLDMGPVQILNVHLRSMFSGESNAAYAYSTVDRDHMEEIQSFSAECSHGLPTLVIGDFNEEPGGVALTYLADRGFQNVLPLYHPGQPTWHNPPDWQMEQTIDHILFDKAFSSLNSWVEDIGDSDHLPVLAHFEEAPP